MKSSYVIGGILVLLVIALAIFFFTRPISVLGPATQATSTPGPTLTSDKVFREVSSQFQFTRDQVRYFTIYGDDRAQYNTGEGVVFAYRDTDAWHVSGPIGSQEVPLCSLLNDTPERYRQACYDENTQQNLYIDPVDGQNVHYPTREAVRYITTPQ